MMEKTEYFERYEKYKLIAENMLNKQLDNKELHPTMQEAMRYSVMSGGKRLRPVLCLATADLFENDAAIALPLAAAIEMIHCYSLVHDDLPAMDDDDMRRSRPTTHIQFGEANAILAGDALLNYAFESMIENVPDLERLPAYIKAMGCIAESAGAKGMVAGQTADLYFEGKADVEISDLKYIHKHKTGAIIKASVMSAAYAQNAKVQELDALSEFGENIGLAFQIIDDILDVIGDQEKMGKTLGKDEKCDKITYIRFFGLEESKARAKQATENAINAIELFADKADFLCALALNMLERTN